jgi:catechol 2,3-dioxygenase-like lactoylglutathione lyase family enzyme
MIDHVSLRVSNLAASRALYETALRPLGYEVLLELPGAVGLGAGAKPDLWLVEGAPTRSVHVAFAAPDNAAVHAFHEGALAAGGRDNGPPGPRDYHPGYYAAFVLDLDGNNVEAVNHRG